MITVRAATLEDTGAISALFRAPISVWQRMETSGAGQTVPYETLNLYERWLHGGATTGAWMSAELSAIFLNHLLLGAGMPFVAIDHERIVGYAEAYINNEPEPFGAHVHLAQVTLSEVGGENVSAGENITDPAGEAVADSLFNAIAERARRLKCRLSFPRTGETALTRAAARRAEAAEHPVEVLQSIRRYAVPARQGQMFYRVNDHDGCDPMQISGWAMPVGRYTSARHAWETLWTPIWSPLPAMKAQKIHRLKLSAGGLDALVLCQQSLYDPRSADIYVWTVKSLTAQMVTALRDWGHREGYRTLWMGVGAEGVKALGADAEADGFTVEICRAETAAIPVL